ncbi:hypothetical protein, partial [Mesorhizobium sp. M0715]|uniref:hypothetical protein n=1 Tax=Mesorhizobium sp. M0715 TaxID=2956990 RepID=UPI0033361AC7
TAPTKTLRQQSLHKTELTARLRRHRKIPVSKTGNHIHTILQQAPCGGDAWQGRGGCCPADLSICHTAQMAEASA